MAQADWSPAVRGAALHVSVPEVLEDAKRALLPVLETTPGWQPGAAAAASVEQVSGAMTNLVYRVSTPGPTTANSAVIVRVFGTGGKLFSQQDERNIFLLASQLGVGPRCLVEFQNGRVEEFLPGDSLTHESFQQPDVSAAIATAMAAFHVRMLARLPAAASQAAAGIESAGAAAGHSDGVPPPASPPAAPPLRPAIYSRIRQWHAAAGEVCAEELQQQGLGGLLEQVEELEALLAAGSPPWVGFCHNDLQYGNMLLFRGGSSSSPGGGGGAAAAAAAQPAADGAIPVAAGSGAAGGAGPAGGSAAVAAATVAVKLIDYEYSTLNDVAFDVANHFCEWAYNYHGDEAHVFHDAWLPSEEQQLAFCRAYVAAMQRQAGRTAVMQPVAAGAAQGTPAAAAPAGQAEGGAAAAAAENGAVQGRPAKRRAVVGSPSAVASGGDGAWLPAAILAAGGSADDSATTGDGGSSGGETGDAADCAARLLCAKARSHTPLVHLKWGLWGLIQHKMSDVDFDYLSYGTQRIARYHKTRSAVLAAQ
ncbi:putative choline kinase 2 [Micractinium conductrix]|uniref:Choline kinase 2 n=1 Tax=Micractinium conductrix TaxID=554055 RepID=A0A2P6VQ00_9CHLO|nr:putative choline kinase 2 [Micractinium conductrix]|eukprot:PSC76159.1 putative choline kinase 2 [Micractinium conductrix]